MGTHTQSKKNKKIQKAHDRVELKQNIAAEKKVFQKKWRKFVNSEEKSIHSLKKKTITNKMIAIRCKNIKKSIGNKKLEIKKWSGTLHIMVAIFHNPHTSKIK